MTEITYKKLKEHRDRAWDMGNKRAMDVLTDFMDFHERKGSLTERQSEYAVNLFEVTSEKALEEFKNYKANLDTDELYREKLRVIAQYYVPTHYHRKTALSILSYLKDNSLTPPSFNDVKRMLNNEYAANVWISHTAEPKYVTGDLVRLRANAGVGYRAAQVDSWMVIAIGNHPINTSHKYNEKVGGTKRYDLLEVGGTTVITVMEKHLKKHRVPKTKKRT